ncbi:DUF5067 domain-containing protein [Hominibacterium faecale]|uniref:DUF5067 domain-containing protein n=1 Tax=Hominibacterium faecale TaxID=2839743 RepID=UPI0022B29A47|nr:DUF5067 domain-containing protein [Hominibacterium faecale]
MQTIKLQVNGKPLVFTNESVSYAGYELYYMRMTKIAHRGGEQPAFVFDYNGKRLALPYDPKDKETVMKIFQRIATLEQQRNKQAAVAAQPEPPKEEPVTPMQGAASDFSAFSTPTPTPDPDSDYNGKKKGYLSTGRLVIGIISMILFIFIAFQSCAAGLSNALEENNALSGSAGLFTAIMFLVAGIVGVCTRNTRGIVGPIITAVLYFIGAAFTIGTGDTYGDLPIWGALSAIFGLMLVFCVVKTKLGKTTEPFYKPLWLIIVVVVIAVGALVLAFTGTGDSKDDTKDASTTAKTEQQKSTKVDKINMDNDEGTLTYVKAKSAKDYEGNPAVLVYFDYTNKKGEASTAFDTFYVQVFHDGIECEMGMSENQNEAESNLSKDIQKGKTVQVAILYTLKDSKSPITLKVTDQSTKNLLDGIYQEQEVKLK